MENRPLISVIMPTLNSDKTIRMALESIRNQNFDQNLIEILIIDGGSTDNTLIIANEFNCRIIPNPDIQPEFAKYYGILNSFGNYAMFLDSDEVLENKNAIENRIQVFKNKNIKLIFTSGYKKPIGSNFINNYINNFSDPFSFFMYGTSSDYRYYFNTIIRKYNHILYDKYAILDIGDKDIIPLSDLCAGNTIDLDYAKQFVESNKNANIVISLIPFIINNTKKIAVLKDDFIIHYSSDSFRKYCRKIQWRIINNIFYKDKAAGFVNREIFNSTWFQFKKYIFIPYSLSFIFPFLVGLYFSIIRKNFILLLNGFLTFYTGVLICYYYVLKIFNIKPKLKAYGR